jgi:maltose-binding protein MalE
MSKKKTTQKVSRRDFLRLAGITAGAGFLAGCGVAPTEVSQPTSVAGTAAPAIKYADQACVHRYIRGGFSGAGPDDKLIKDIQEKALRDEYGLNVSLEVESAPWSDIDGLITTRMETQAVDSVERDGGAALNWLAQEGLLQDIEEELTDYGKSLNTMLPSAAYDYFKRGGKRWVFATFYSTPVDTEYIHVRRDWLNKIDRDVPQTLEELEECLRLFKEKKLGGDVTIPLANDLGGWLIPSYVLQGPFAPEPDEQKKMLAAGEDFEYEFGCAMRPRPLELLQKWFVDGLLNPEWATFKGEDTESAIQKGYVGAIFSGWWNLNSQLKSIQKDIDPSQDWVQIFPPVGLKDVPNSGRILTEIPLERAAVVTSWANCPEAIVAFADWQNKSWENHMLSNYGIEGKHWKWAPNGAYVDLRSAAPNQEYSGMRYSVWAPQWNNKFQQLPAPEDDPHLDPRIPSLIYGPHIYNRTDTTKPQANEYPTLSRIYHFTAWDWKESAQFEPDLRALRDEWATRIIKNEVGISDGLKGFWDQWMASGGETRLKEISEQYDAYAKANPAMTDNKVFFSPENWNTTIQYPKKP